MRYELEPEVAALSLVRMGAADPVRVRRAAVRAGVPRKLEYVAEQFDRRIVDRASL